jgi:transposase
MDLARYVVEAVVLEGRSYREMALAHGVSKSWGESSWGGSVRAATRPSCPGHAPRGPSLTAPRPSSRTRSSSSART